MGGPNANTANPPGTFRCGRCQGCRAQKTMEWKLRIMMEARYFTDNWFVTWTLADQYLPDDFSVHKETHQKLIKRIRYEYNNDIVRQDDGRIGLRHYGIGEYGCDETKTQRPHYHTILLNLPLNDLDQIENSKSGFPQWQSKRLEKCWPFGRVTIGKAEPSTISYTTGYQFKKLGGKKAEEYYTRPHSVTGEICKVNPEFGLMSRNPGLGYRWIEEFRVTDLQHDFMVIDGRKIALPQFAVRERTEMLSDDENEGFSDRFWDKLERSVRAKRSDAYARRQADMTPERLAVREELHFLRTQHLARGGGIG